MGMILDAFAQGRITVIRSGYERGSTHEAAYARVNNAERALCHHLDAEGMLLYRALEDAWSDADILSNDDRFLYGFRLGVLMMTEVYAGREDLLQSDPT